MDDWGDLRFVLALSRARTMKGAARLLGTNPTTVSRRIDHITKIVGRQLFDKEADGWLATDEAKSLTDLAIRLEEGLEKFESTLRMPDDQLIGRISINSYQAITTQALVPNLGRFADRYPNVRLDIRYRATSSLLRGEVDIALRLSRPDEGRVISKRIGTRVSKFYRRKGTKDTSHWIGLSREFDDLPMMQQGIVHFGCEPAIRVGSLQEIETALLSSNMAGPMLTCAAKGQEDLELIEDSKLLSIRPIYLVYHESRRNDMRLEAVKTWIESCFAGANNCSCGKCEFDGTQTN